MPLAADLTYNLELGRNNLLKGLRQNTAAGKTLAEQLNATGRQGGDSLDRLADIAVNGRRQLGGIDGPFRRAVGRMDARLQRFGLSSRAVLDGLALRAGLPGLGALGAVGAAALPIAAVGAGIAGIAAGLGTASEQAVQFESRFRAIANINQDKTAGQLDRLQTQLAGFATSRNLAPTEALTGYYDLQSATGKYGEEAIAILGKVNKFSVATQGNFADNINASAKAMVQFGFGADKLDEYLTSNAKTVQLGITTFEELGRVQTEYLGTAAAAGQSINSANKLFAALTSSGSNAATSATLTKGALEGLSDPRITAQLQKQGVAIFDNEGKMLSLDRIAANLDATIKGFAGSDLQFQNFAGSVGGTEGFRAFLAKLKADGDGLLAGFAKFDAVEFDVDKAFALSQNDPVQLRKQIGAKLSGIFTEVGLGLGLKNLQLGGLRLVEGALDGIYRAGSFVVGLKIGERLVNGFTAIGQRIGELESVKTVLGGIAAAGEYLAGLNVGDRFADGLAWIDAKATALGRTLDGGYQLLQRNADLIEPVLITGGLALLAFNAQAIFAGVTALPRLVASLGLATASFVGQHAAVVLVRGALLAEAAAMGIATLATKGLALANTALNAVLYANPVGLVIGGLVLLGGAIYIAYQKSETFRAGVSGLFNVIKGGIAILKPFATILEGIFSRDFSLVKQGISDQIEAVKNFNPARLFREGFDEKFELEATARRAAEDEQIAKGGLLQIGVEQPGTSLADSLTSGLGSVLGGFTPNLELDGSAVTDVLGKGNAPKLPLPTAPTLSPTSGPGPTATQPTGGAAPTGGTDFGQLARSGAKNINVQIGKLVENLTVAAQTVSEGVDEVNGLITQGLIDAVRNAEVELGY